MKTNGMNTIIYDSGSVHDWCYPSPSLTYIRNIDVYVYINLR